MATEPQQPSFGHALLCVSGTFACLMGGLFLWQIQLHSLLVICVLWSCIHSIWLGYSFSQLREMMMAGVSKALPALFIFLLIGMVIASFMLSGTVAALLYYGLNFLQPTIFLLVALLLSSLMSVATGTSWGTVATLGVVLLTIGEALQMPLPLVAGVIVSGATFGDKLSPISDTTNLAALSAHTSLYRHIYSMSLTTAPSYFLVIIIVGVSGYFFGQNSFDDGLIRAYQQAITSHFSLNPLLVLAPIAVMLVGGIKRIAPEITMLLSVVVALLIAVFYQSVPFTAALNSLWSNEGFIKTGVSVLDDLFARGGMASMSWTLLLSILALAMGGVLHGSGFLQALLRGLLIRLQRFGSIVAATIGAGVVGNAAMGEAYISIVLNSQLFAPLYDNKKLDRAVLSRSVEEGATMTTALIPWSTAGAFYAATLSVPVEAYLPFAFFNYLNPLISIALAYLGWGLLRKTPI